MIRELLLSRFNNSLDLFASDTRVRRYALFPFRFEMSPCVAAQFGYSRLDSCNANVRQYLLNYLNGFPLSQKTQDGGDDLFNLLIWDRIARQGPSSPRSYTYPIRDQFGSVGVLTSRQFSSTLGRGLAFTTKLLGNPANTSSHFDIGSYAIAFNGVTLGGDSGRPISWKRVASGLSTSLAHPLPLVSGQPQLSSFDIKKNNTRLPSIRYTTFSSDTDVINMDLKSSYPSGLNLRSLQRKFMFDRKRSTLNVTDFVSFVTASAFSTTTTSTMQNWVQLTNTTGYFTTPGQSLRLYVSAKSSTHPRGLSVTANLFTDLDIRVWRIIASFRDRVINGTITFEFSTYLIRN